jgi:hypothetical protein
MLTREETAGTNLALLQAYPLGTLEVLVSFDHRQPSMRGVVGLLIGLRNEDNEQIGTVMTGSEAADDLCRTGVPVSLLKPILRPFSQLCTPLEDGTIPAVEVAKMILDLNDQHCEDWYLGSLDATLDLDGFIGDCVVFDSAGSILLTIYNDWLIGADDTLVPVEAYDCLRSKHFALPVNGRPLVEGVDYIAKAPASPSPSAPTTREKEEG